MSLNAYTSEDTELKKMIGHMLIVGFDNAYVDKDSKIIKQINKYELGGVILFDRFYNDRNKTKNISSPKQLKNLTNSLKKLSNKPLLISVDQEGGKVARLKPDYGFKSFKSAKDIASLSEKEAKKSYADMAKMLKENGINCNFAPVVDLEINPKNKVIVKLKRSFGKDPTTVNKYAKILINMQNKEGIISVLKHFPGHGSSLSDSHLGFVDITKTWDKKELEPYKILIKSKSIDMIMTAHVFNSLLDEKYPATLSKKINTKLLRQKMGYDGVIVSDDLQMRAISKHYSLKQTVILAINAGVDMLLFGNQLSTQDIDELVEIIFQEIKNGTIPYNKILEANARIKKLYE
jgi:beta-N-acetylhexosaminidase